MRQGQSRVFDDAPLSGVQQVFHTLGNGEYIIESAQDVEPIIELNKYVRDNAASGWKGTSHHIASIPLVEVEKLMKAQILGGGMKVLDPKKFKAYLNSPDQRAFRTKTGAV